MRVMRLFLIFLFCAPFINFAQADTTKAQADSEQPSNIFYLHGNYTNTFRTLEDKSPFQIHGERLKEEGIVTGGIELGTYIYINKYAYLSLGFNFFSGGEEYTFIDSVTDSTFYYKNRYRQIGIPFRLNLVYGKKLQAFAFGGVVPSSILHQQISSKYTTAQGAEVENEDERVKSGLLSFQFATSLGAGIKYNFGNGAFYAFSEFRPHFTNTFEGAFLIHRMRSTTFGLGISLKVN